MITITEADVTAFLDAHKDDETRNATEPAPAGHGAVDGARCVNINDAGQRCIVGQFLSEQGLDDAYLRAHKILDAATLLTRLGDAGAVKIDIPTTDQLAYLQVVADAGRGSRTWALAISLYRQQTGAL